MARGTMVGGLGGGAMEFRLFGPLEVRNATGSVDVGPPRQRTVLAALLVDAERPVPVDTLVDRVWGDAPPDRVRHSLYVYVARLRQALGPSVRLVNRSGGYVADVDPDTVDLHRFRRLVDRARDTRLPDAERAALLRQALDLWRGTPLADLSSAWAATVREAWRQRHLDATVSCAQAELTIGHAAGIVGTLVDLTAEYPLAEPLTAALMRALHETGRGAEALDHYSRIRRRLVDELGTEPGAELQDLHRSILRSGNARRAPTLTPTAPAGQAPALLPLDVYGFTGRGPELAQLDTILAATDDQPTAVVISAIAGTAGVGKTALAVHWAHRSAHRFPDGQLYVNLRGFDPSGSVMAPAEAVRGFLDALQVPAERVPADLTAQVGLYRTLLAGKRVLIVLDNARDAEQVRPLLPGAPGCLVLVTSRNQLTSLVAAEGAQPLALGMLTPAEAQQLLARRLGAARIVAEPVAVEKIITTCAGLPLALAIVAARAATRPNMPLADVAVELGETGTALDAFNAGDIRTDLRAVFSWSYSTLTAPAARMFRLLGLRAGSHLTTTAAASLAGLSLEQARSSLSELVQANLVSEPAPGQLTLHDLLTVYATEKVLDVETETERREAVHRLFDHYVHTAVTAAKLTHPSRTPIDPISPLAGAMPAIIRDDKEGLGWFKNEYDVLLAAVNQAASAGFDTHAWQMAWGLVPFLNRTGRYADLTHVGQVALGAAQRSDDRHGQAWAHRQLGRAFTQQGFIDQAYAHLARGLELLEVLQDQDGMANTHLGLAWLSEQRKRPQDSLNHARRGLALFRATGNRPGQAWALNAVGWSHALLGDYRRTLNRCRCALSMFQELGNLGGQAGIWDSLGYAYQHLGNFDEAVMFFRRAIEAYRELSDRYGEAETLVHLGDLHEAVGDSDAARAAWRNALATLDDLGHPDSDRVRAKLG
jgi:DNA-binding SARP family transcriptional activator/tetratricopeptide (TPR) repeat protein